MGLLLGKSFNLQCYVVLYFMFESIFFNKIYREMNIMNSDART